MEERRSEREKTKVTYTDSKAIDEFKWTKLLETKTFLDHDFELLLGSEITLEWASTVGMVRPVIVPKPEGLDMEMPSSLTVDQVVEHCGRERMVDVIQVSTQTDIQMSLEDWGQYFNTVPEKRERILNVISLEVGKTTWGRTIKRPRLVRELDWIDLVWPRTLKLQKLEYPQVQLYCLMGVQDSYTDFHIDFGGTSVFYHIIHGEKIFYFIEPTDENLKIYADWSTNPVQSDIFLGDLVSKCYKVHLYPGNTAFIPSGWIHAVFTPKDAMVLGGNFLHGYSIPMQLRINQIEIDTWVPFRFRFPYFITMQWYAAKFYLYKFKELGTFSRKELDSLQALHAFLSNLADKSTDMTLSKEERKMIRSEVPVELRNVRLLLKTLKCHLDAAIKNIAVEEELDISWASDVSEMEFVDSDEGLDAFKPQEDRLLESSSEESYVEKPIKPRVKKVKVKKVKPKQIPVQPLKAPAPMVTTPLKPKHKKNVYDRLAKKLKR